MFIVFLSFSPFLHLKKNTSPLIVSKFCLHALIFNSRGSYFLRLKKGGQVPKKQNKTIYGWSNKLCQWDVGKNKVSHFPVETFFFFYFRERESKRARVSISGGKGRASQADSRWAQSPTRGSIPPPVRAGPELKPRVNRLNRLSRPGATPYHTHSRSPKSLRAANIFSFSSDTITATSWMSSFFILDPGMKRMRQRQSRPVKDITITWVKNKPLWL